MSPEPHTLTPAQVRALRVLLSPTGALMRDDLSGLWSLIDPHPARPYRVWRLDARDARALIRHRLVTKRHESADVAFSAYTLTDTGRQHAARITATYAAPTSA